MQEIIGGILMITGGGMVTAASVSIHLAHRRGHAGMEFGTGLAEAMRDTSSAPLPADILALIDRIP